MRILIMMPRMLFTVIDLCSTMSDADYLLASINTSDDDDGTVGPPSLILWHDASGDGLSNATYNESMSSYCNCLQTSYDMNVSSARCQLQNVTPLHDECDVISDKVTLIHLDVV
jgi:hypothetical protein